MWISASRAARPPITCGLRALVVSVVIGRALSNRRIVSAFLCLHAAHRCPRSCWKNYRGMSSPWRKTPRTLFRRRLRPWHSHGHVVVAATGTAYQSARRSSVPTHCHVHQSRRAAAVPVVRSRGRGMDKLAARNGGIARNPRDGYLAPISCVSNDQCTWASPPRADEADPSAPFSGPFFRQLRVAQPRLPPSNVLASR